MERKPPQFPIKRVTPSEFVVSPATSIPPELIDRKKLRPFSEIEPIISEEYLRKDYWWFMSRRGEGDTIDSRTVANSKDIGEIREALYKLSRKNNPTQAWEYRLARRWERWTNDEQDRVLADLTEDEIKEWSMCFFKRES